MTCYSHEEAFNFFLQDTQKAEVKDAQNQDTEKTQNWPIVNMEGV